MNLPVTQSIFFLLAESFSFRLFHYSWYLPFVLLRTSINVNGNIKIETAEYKNCKITTADSTNNWKSNLLIAK